MASQLSNQLAEVFKAGLDAKPELGASIAEALSSYGGDGGDKPSSNDKATKAESNYREADSEEVRCGTCEHFRDPGRCELVSGSISADMVCDYFEGVEEPDDSGE